MRLSKRIYALADSVVKGHTAADIGTDHGYVPMLLIRDGISPRVIMSDISEASLAKAVGTFTQCGLIDRVSPDDFRTGDGLETIQHGEVDDIIIGGLGGHTIADILAADPSRSRSFSRLILQPRKHSGALRYWLCSNGWDIISEQLAEEGKFACEIITAVPAVESGREDRVSALLPDTSCSPKCFRPAILRHIERFMVAQDRAGCRRGLQQLLCADH